MSMSTILRSRSVVTQCPPRKLGTAAPAGWPHVWYVHISTERRDITAHAITMMITVGAFFGLLWFAVVIMGMAPDVAFLVSLVTLILVGLGVMFTTTVFRGDKDEG